MKIIVIISFILTFSNVKSGSKYYDGEIRPYEFGFNLEGTQHRHEKKDLDGTIMGEYGFLTADGIYHITNYATDVNGNFKIISMKNLDVKKLKKASTSESPRLMMVTENPISSTTQPKRKKTFPPLNIQSTTQHPVTIASCSNCIIPVSEIANDDYDNSEIDDNIEDSNEHIIEQETMNDNKDKEDEPNYDNIDIVENDYDELRTLSRNRPTNANIKQSNGLTYFSNSITKSPVINSNKNDINNYNIGRVKTNNNNIDYNSVSNINNIIDKKISNKLVARPYETPTNTPRNILTNIHQNNNQHKITKQNITPTSILLNSQDNNHEKITKQNLVNTIMTPITPITSNKALNNLLYRFYYTLDHNGHYEQGDHDGNKEGEYFVIGADGIKRLIKYTADKNGYHPSISSSVVENSVRNLQNIDKNRNSLINYEFKWFNNHQTGEK